MFHVLIEERRNNIVTESIDIKKMKTESLYNLLGRYFLKYEENCVSHKENGYEEREFTTKDTTLNVSLKTTVSFWRVSKEEGENKTPKVKQSNIRNYKQFVPSVVAPPKPEVPNEERTQVMFDAGVLYKSAY